MVVSWLLFPAVLLLLATGCGLLVDWLSRARLPGVLVAPTGVAALVVIAGFLTRSDATAELAAPACAVAAVAGFVLGRARLRLPDPWPLGAAAAVFLVYGLPVLASGEPTFAGYIRLDDTSTWLALIDRAMENGRSMAGLAPSTYEATLSANLATGYPLGSLLPWAVAARLLDVEPAWVFQPWLAFMAAMLALVVWHLARAIVARTGATAIAFIASQAALLYAYSLWGGVKEIASALLVALAAALVPWTTERTSRAFTRPLPLAVVAAATLLALSVGGAAWIGVALLGGLALMRSSGWTLREALAPVGMFVVAGLVVALPAVLSASTFLGGAAPLASGTAANTGDELGNLVRPLGVEQALGVWLAGDFRNDPLGITTLFLVVTGAAAVLGLVFVVRRRAWPVVLYAATTLAGAAAITAYGSAWIDAKALTLASPLVLLLAGIGAACLWERRTARPAALVLGLVVAGGVVWSNVLAYREVNLAPYEQLGELEEIGRDISGKGPALMTEYQPYGVRHFLRDADPEGASELRRRTVALRSGATVPKAGYADVDEFPPASLQPYRTLVLRRSPAASRPPAAFTRVSSGRWYEVWERRAVAAPVERLPLGDALQPAAAAPCSEVMRLARLVPGGRLATVFRVQNTTVELADLKAPASWKATPPYLTPGTEGTATGSLQTGAPGRYEVWVGGGFRPGIAVAIDGRRVAARRHLLTYTGGWASFGTVELGAGSRRIELRRDADRLAPGAAGPAHQLGPLALARDTGPPEVSYVPASDARSLCGKTLDWIEALPAA